MSKYNILTGIGIGSLLISIIGLIYYSSIPSDHIFVSETNDEVLTPDEMFDKVFPIFGTMFVTSCIIICLSLLLRLYLDNKHPLTEFGENQIR